MLRIRFELFFYLHGNDVELMQWRRFTFGCWLNSIESNREIWIDSPVSRRRYTHKLLVIWPFMPWLHISPCRLVCSMLCYVILLVSLAQTHTCFGLKLSKNFSSFHYHFDLSRLLARSLVVACTLARHINVEINLRILSIRISNKLM